MLRPRSGLDRLGYVEHARCVRRAYNDGSRWMTGVGRAERGWGEHGWGFLYSDHWEGCRRELWRGRVGGRLGGAATRGQWKTRRARKREGSYMRCPAPSLFSPPLPRISFNLRFTLPTAGRFGDPPWPHQQGLDLATVTGSDHRVTAPHSWPAHRYPGHILPSYGSRWPKRPRCG